MTRLGTVRSLSLLSLSLVFVLAPAARAAAELKEGSPAPAFSAKGDDGKSYGLEALKGKYVIVYFYPKDDTSGCTMEAEGFRDDAPKYAERGAVVLGVSLDDAESHKAFRAKHGLNFPLLVDGKRLAEQFGVPTTFGFAARQTFVIGKDGRILKVFRKVDVKSHSDEILALLK
jgi:peroxiredoxin Q/BCP